MTKGARPNVLLVGNGLNRAAGSPSWAALLNGVARAVGGTPVHEKETRPFPLLYERLLLEARRNDLQFTETKLKIKIAEATHSITTGPTHREVMALPFDEFMTTNYDQALENASLGPGSAVIASSFVDETRYSLFRHVRLTDERPVWYIHGDARKPNSILLGYDQYSGFLQQMRLYVTAGVQYERGSAGPVFKRTVRTADRNSWITRFFDADVWILGLGLEFVEIHLWWLLTYRARLRSRSKGASPNIIRYVCRGNVAKDDAKLSLLRTLEVEPVLIGGEQTEWNSFYDQSFKKIRKLIPK